MTQKSQVPPLNDSVTQGQIFHNLTNEIRTQAGNQTIEVAYFNTKTGVMAMGAGVFPQSGDIHCKIDLAARTQKDISIWTYRHGRNG